MSRSVILLAIFMLFLALSLMPLGTGMIDFMAEDDIPEEDDSTNLSSIPFAWTRISLQRLLIFLQPGLSIFTLFIIYLGGRSKNRRFNDRTIDANMVLKGVTLSLKAALSRAVFNFLNPSKYRTKDAMNIAFLPTFQSYGGTTS